VPTAAHLLVNVRVVDASGVELASGRDLAGAAPRARAAAQMTFAAAGPSIERKGLTRWDCGHLPATLAAPVVGATHRLPGLVDEHDSVALLLMDTESAALAGRPAPASFALSASHSRRRCPVEEGRAGIRQPALQLQGGDPDDVSAPE